MAEEARQRVPHAGMRSVGSQVPFAAPALPIRRSVPKRLIVDVMAPDGARQMAR